MAKKINRRGRGGNRELLLSLCPLCSLWFSEPIPEDNKKSRFYPPPRSSAPSAVKFPVWFRYVPGQVVPVWMKSHDGVLGT